MKTMNTFIAIVIVATTCIIWPCGCKSHKIQIIHNDKVVTNTVPVKAFNDESYIWEGWSFSTNQVNDVNY